MNQITDNNDYPIIDIDSIVYKFNNTSEKYSTGDYLVFSLLDKGLVNFECAYSIE